MRRLYAPDRMHSPFFKFNDTLVMSENLQRGMVGVSWSTSSGWKTRFKNYIIR